MTKLITQDVKLALELIDVHVCPLRRDVSDKRREEKPESTVLEVSSHT